MSKHISIETTKPFLQAFQGKGDPNPPVWLMRQAGRYLPEYKQLRASTDSFLTCCYTPSLATEITLQPLRRFDLDAAIIFSDILVIPDALGVSVTFEEKLGPQIGTLKEEKDLNALRWDISKLSPVYEAITQTAQSLPKDVTLIGFAGAPWTLAAYMLEGKSSDQFMKARLWAYTYPQGFNRLLALLEEKIIDHLSNQIQAGCEVVQVFDSWAGILNAEEIYEWSLKPLQRIVTALKARHPSIPIILFPRGAGNHYKNYIMHSGADAISIDQYTELLDFADQSTCLLQGNLDPLLLASHLPKALERTKKIITAMVNKPFIFNLGHGVLPHTPPEHVAALIHAIKGK